MKFYFYNNSLTTQVKIGSFTITTVLKKRLAVHHCHKNRYQNHGTEIFGFAGHFDESYEIGSRNMKAVKFVIEVFL